MTAAGLSGSKIPVLIVGAGPVGLALAAELGRLNINCLLVEQGDGSFNHPRASELNARTMAMLPGAAMHRRIIRSP